MKICPNCKTELSDEVKFCNKCGANVEMANGAVPPVAPQPEVVPPVAPQPQVAPYSQPQMAQPVAPAVDPYDHTAEFTPEDISANKVIALCPYIFNIFGVIVALLASKESPYVAFHVRQALKIYVCVVLSTFLAIIPFLGWLCGVVAEIICIVLILMGFFGVCGGKAKEVPIIRSFGFLK